MVWHDWLDAKLEPQRHQPIGPAVLPPSAYAAAARAVLSQDDRITTIRFDADRGPVMVTASKPAPAAGGRPERTNVWLDPRDAQVIDRASASSGPLQVMHVLHGSLMVPGWGRTIVGWVGVFMLVSSLSGMWLWWPLSGSFATGLRWRRRNTLSANLHYLAGFWIMIPLAMLSFTGAWISFPKVFGAFETRPAPSAQARAASQRARPLARPTTNVDQAVAAANAFATGPLQVLAWPTDQKGGMENLLPAARRAGRNHGRPTAPPIREGGQTPPSPKTLGPPHGPLWQQRHPGMGAPSGRGGYFSLGGNSFPAPVVAVTPGTTFFGGGESKKNPPGPPLPGAF